jgi:ketosteroid isomerase-like protein
MVNKNIVCLFTISLILLFKTYSQEKISLKDSLSIMNVLNSQVISWNKGNIDSFMDGYIKSNDLVFSGSGGPIYGWENTKERYLKSYPNRKIMGKLSFDIKRIRKVSKNVAYLIGEYHLKRSIEDSHGHFTLIWKKIKGKWYIVSDHTSSKT